MDYISVFLKHVDLFDSLDWLDIQLLEDCLEFFVVRSSVLVNLLDLPPGSTLSATNRRVESASKQQKTKTSRNNPECTHSHWRGQGSDIYPTMGKEAKVSEKMPPAPATPQ